MSRCQVYPDAMVHRDVLGALACWAACVIQTNSPPTVATRKYDLDAFIRFGGDGTRTFGSHNALFVREVERGSTRSGVYRVVMRHWLDAGTTHSSRVTKRVIIVAAPFYEPS